MEDTNVAPATIHLHMDDLARMMRTIARLNIGHMVDTRVQGATWRRMVAHGLGPSEDDVRRYLEILQTTGMPEVREWVERATVNITSLFRYGYSFDRFVAQCVPQLPADHPVTVWSAGCSYGCELLTFLVILDEHRPHMQHQFIGTDIDQVMVWRARWGRLHRDQIKKASAEWLEQNGKWLDPDYWYANASLMRRCRFIKRSVTHKPPCGECDIVAYNNVRQYLSPAAHELAARQITKAVKVGGFLFTDLHPFEGRIAGIQFERLERRIFKRVA